MELHKFHVADLGAATDSHCHAIAGGDARIGRVAIHLPQASGREQHHARAQLTADAVTANEHGAANPIGLDQQIRSEIELGKLDFCERTRFRIQRPPNLASGGIAMRV